MDKVLRICLTCNKRTKHTFWKRDSETETAWSFCLMCGNAVSLKMEVIEYSILPSKIETSSN